MSLLDRQKRGSPKWTPPVLSRSVDLTWLSEGRSLVKAIPSLLVRWWGPAVKEETSGTRTLQKSNSG